MSKKQTIATIINHINEHNPGLPNDAKILCGMIAVSEFFDEIVGEIDEKESAMWKIMFITMKDKDGHKKYVKGRKRDVKKMFDYSFEWLTWKFLGKC